MAEDPADQFDTAPERRDLAHAKPSLGWWFCSVAVFLLLYALSTGPVAKLYSLYKPAPLAGRILDIVYFPVEIAYQRSSYAKGLIDWYTVDVWRVRPKQ